MSTDQTADLAAVVAELKTGLGTWRISRRRATSKQPTCSRVTKIKRAGNIPEAPGLDGYAAARDPAPRPGHYRWPCVRERRQRTRRHLKPGDGILLSPVGRRPVEAAAYPNSKGTPTLPFEITTL